MTRFLSRERNRWLAALFVTALLLTCTYLVSDVVFQTNDDNAIASAASGGVTGAPYPGNGFTSYLYGLLLSGLYGALPDIPWHASLLTLAQALGLAAVLRSVLFICVQKHIRPLWGLVGFAALYAGLGVKFMTYVQFTAAPGYCAAGLAALLWTLPKGKRARAFNCAAGCGLMAFGLLLRFKGGLLTLPVPLMAGGTLILQKDENRRAAFLCCLSLAIFTAGAWALDNALYRANEPGWQEQAAFDEYSAVLLDYHNDDEAYALALQVTDWSPELIRCVRGWNLLMDERFNTENLRRLAEAIEAAQAPPDPAQLLYKTGSVLKRYQEFRWNALALGLLGCWAFWRALRAKRWQEGLLLAGLAGSLLAVIAFFYGWMNRFPDRVAFAYAWPVSVMIWLLFLGGSDPRNGRSRKAPAWRTLPDLGAALLLAAALCTLIPHASDMLVIRGRNPSRESRAELTARVNAYAAARPETIFVTNVTQGFPAFSTERPPVNLYEWGSAMVRSPMYKEKATNLGYPDGLTARNLADGPVRLLLTDPGTLAMVMDCVQKDISDWTAVSEDDQGIFHVYRLE